MNIFLTVNLTHFEDTSGLPQYYRSLLKRLSTKDNFILNVNADPKSNPGKLSEVYEGHNILTFTAPQFIDGVEPGLLQEIMSSVEMVHNRFGIQQIIYPDYLFHSSVDLGWCRANGITNMMFIHLLNRGMLNVSSKQLYYQKMGISLEYLNNSSFLEWTMVNQSDSFICNSEFTAQDLVRYYPDETEGKKIHVAPLGVEKDEFEYSPYLDSPTWMYFGRLTAQKGLYYISKDIVDHMEEYKENPLILAGEGELESGFFKAWFYDKTVEWVGNLKHGDLQEKLRGIKYCIFPSIYEPWCLALNEAMAMGKICIVQSGKSGMTEQIDDGINGFHFDFKSGSIIEFIKELESGCSCKLEDASKFARSSARSFENHFKTLEEIL